jgi:hypothetical protein
MTSILGTGLTYTCTLTHPDGTSEKWEQPNLMPQAAINHIASLVAGSGSLIANWYVGVFEGNYVPTSDITAAGLQSPAVESSAYSGAARPSWNHAYDGVSVIDNLASEASFTFTADKTIYGAFICSSSTKSGTSGTLLSIARFSVAKIVTSGSVLSVGAGLTLAAEA